MSERRERKRPKMTSSSFPPVIFSSQRGTSLEFFSRARLTNFTIKNFTRDRISRAYIHTQTHARERKNTERSRRRAPRVVSVCVRVRERERRFSRVSYSELNLKTAHIHLHTKNGDHRNPGFGRGRRRTRSNRAATTRTEFTADTGGRERGWGRDNYRYARG